MTSDQLKEGIYHNLTPYEFFVMEKKWRKATSRLTHKSFANFINLFANKGFWCNLKTDLYRGERAWSNSRLGILALELQELEYKGPERAFTFGTAVHEMFLENEIFDIKEFNLRKSEMKIINEIQEKLYQNEFFVEITSKGECEKPIFWTDDTTGLKCKGKVDIEYKKIIFDIKTTAAKTEDEFLKSFRKYDYDRQAAFYLDGSGCDTMIFIAISKFSPYPTIPVKVQRGDDNYNIGRRKYQFLLRKTQELNLIP